jgi:hypothetical protein
VVAVFAFLADRFVYGSAICQWGARLLLALAEGG